MAAFNADGSRLATADETVRRGDGHNGLSVAVLEGHWGRVVTVAFHPDGQRIVTAGADGGVRVWGVSNAEIQSRRTSPTSAVNDSVGPPKIGSPATALP